METRQLELAKRRERPLATIGTAPALRARRLGIAVAGFAVLTVGVALLVVPIPGTSVVVIPFGLAILAREFLWARRLLNWSAGAVRRTWAGVRHLVGFAARRVSTSLPSSHRRGKIKVPRRTRIVAISRAVPVRT